MNSAYHNTWILFDGALGRALTPWIEDNVRRDSKLTEGNAMCEERKVLTSKPEVPTRIAYEIQAAEGLFSENLCSAQNSRNREDRRLPKPIPTRPMPAASYTAWQDPHPAPQCRLFIRQPTRRHHRQTSTTPSFLQSKRRRFPEKVIIYQHPPKTSP
jgi:hypothetical protein